MKTVKQLTYLLNTPRFMYFGFNVAFKKCTGHITSEVGGKCVTTVQLNTPKSDYH